MAAQRILLVDDELDILLSLESILERAGYCVLTAQSGAEALQRIQTFAPDLVLLDIMMPGMNGREVLRRLRERDNTWPAVVILSQVQGADEHSWALDEGADDYIDKPCDKKELVSRVRAVLRRSKPSAATFARADELRCDDLRLDRRRRRAYLKRQELNLKPKVFALLEYLMMHAGEVCSQEKLLDEVWGWDDTSGPHTVEVRAAELRRALGEKASRPRYIETTVGQGYCFRGKVEVVV